LYIQVHSYLHSYSCPCTSSLMAADERFHGKESGYQLEETARSSQENMDLSDSRWYWNVTARLLGCLHSSWPWKRDATVSEDYALLMMMTVTSAKDSMSCLAFVWLLSVCLSIYRRSIFEQWSHHVNTISLLTYLITYLTLSFGSYPDLDPDLGIFKRNFYHFNGIFNGISEIQHLLLIG